MAELATIARPYAEALFRVAQSGNLNAWSEWVRELAAVAGHPDMLALSTDPKVTHGQVIDVVMAALRSPSEPAVRNFVATLVENGRLSVMPEIAAQFDALRNASAGSADARIVSAFPLKDEQVKELAAALERKFGRKLNASVTVDPSLLGGVRVEVGDEVLDASVRARLAAMQTTLTI